MPTNTASQFASDVEAYIADETLPLARRQLVVYRFGDPLTLPKGRGASYTATRFNRIPLPFQPLTEGVPPPGESMTISQVTATAQQWGDRVIITDVAELTIKHPLFKKAIELTALQISETLERNTFVNLLGGTQVNYVGAVGSRAALTTTSQINGTEINRIAAQLMNIGAPRYMGDELTDTVFEADGGGSGASDNPRTQPHYVAVMHPFVMGDLYKDGTIVTALSYSDINRLYNYEFGEWRSIRMCWSNLVPSWTGLAAVTAAAAGGGALGAGTYQVEVTGSDTQNQYESQIYQKQTGLVVGANGTVTLTTPNTPGFTYSVYLSQPGGSSLTNLGLSAQGPNFGPLAGQATQIPPNTAVTVTALGIAQVPPAPPATGVTVYPTFVFGRGAYGQVVLDDVGFTYLQNADKSDPLNQLRVVGWKAYYSTLIENNTFFARLESTSSLSPTFG